MHSMRQRWTAALLAALLVLALGACAAGESGSSQAAEPASLSSAGESSAAEPAQESGDEEAAVDYSAGLTDEGYYAGVTALDYVTLPDFQHTAVPEEVSAVTQEQVQQALDERLAAMAGEVQVTDRAVADGDRVNIDYVGSIDGVEFSGGNTNGAGTTVIIGVTNYIDDFLEQLIGHMPGETFDVNVTFPEDYGVEDLNGKDAVFVTTVNYILEDQPPELTDEFVYSNWYTSDGWSNVAEAREGEEALLRSAAVSNYLLESIEEEAEISEIPQPLVDFQIAAMTNYYRSMASAYSMSLEDLLTSYFGEDATLDSVVEENRSDLENAARESLILQAVSETLELKPQDEDIDRYFREVMGAEDWSSYLERYGRPYLALVAREYMVQRSLGELG